MSVITLPERATPNTTEVADAVDAPFAFNVQVVTDLRPGEAVPGCDTSNGCASTCASACASNA